MDERRYMGKEKEGVGFPVPPYSSEMDKEYFIFIDQVKEEIRRQRLRVTLNANASMICLYWNSRRGEIS